MSLSRIKFYTGLCQFLAIIIGNGYQAWLNYESSSIGQLSLPLFAYSFMSSVGYAITSHMEGKGQLHVLIPQLLYIPMCLLILGQFFYYN